MARTVTYREFDEVSITMRSGQWLVLLHTAANYDNRVPREQGDGGECLQIIADAIGAEVPDQSAAEPARRRVAELERLERAAQKLKAASDAHDHKAGPLAIKEIVDAAAALSPSSDGGTVE